MDQLLKIGKKVVKSGLSSNDHKNNHYQNADSSQYNRTSANYNSNVNNYGQYSVGQYDNSQFNRAQENSQFGHASYPSPSQQHYGGYQPQYNYDQSQYGQFNHGMPTPAPIGWTDNNIQPPYGATVPSYSTQYGTPTFSQPVNHAIPSHAGSYGDFQTRSHEIRSAHNSQSQNKNRKGGLTSFLDMDGDGKITEKDFGIAAKKVHLGENMGKSFFKKLDKNHNGVLETSEVLGAVSSFQKTKKHGSGYY